MRTHRVWMITIALAIIASLLQLPIDGSLSQVPPTYYGVKSGDLCGKALERMDCDGDSIWEIAIMKDSAVNVYEYDSNQQTFSSMNLTYTTREEDLDDLAVGDFNGDGYDDLAVSDHDSDCPTTPPTSDVGRIDICLSSGSGLVHTDTLYGRYIAGNPASSSDFGYSIDSGDFDADGYDDLIVGAPNWPGSSGDVGEAYIYWGFNADPDPNYGMTNSDPNHDWWDLFFSSGAPDSIKIIDPDQPDFNDIGWCVRSLGDVNADIDDDVVHYDDFAITDFDDDFGMSNYGIGVFYGDDRGSISSTPDEDLDSIGYHYTAVDVDSGDINGDGYNDLITGTLPDITDSTSVGTSVLIYPGSNNGISANDCYIQSSGPNGIYDDEPTFDIACLGDENNDGCDDILMSRPNDDSEGIVFCWNGVSDLQYLTCASWNLTGGQTGQLMGYSRICAGKAICGMPDMDNNGYDEAFIGSPFWDNQTSDWGKVEYFR